MKQIKNKQYKDVNGFVALIGSGQIMKAEFIVSVSNDTHTTLSVCCKAAPEVQYSIDITDIVKDLKI